METIRIKTANHSDLKKISYLGKAFVSRSISSKFISFDQQNFLKALKILIEKQIAYIWVAREGKKIAGAVCLIVTPNIYNKTELLGDIYFIDVLPEYQRLGIAKRLIKTAEVFARERGIIAVTIAFKDKKIADSMYNSAGFILFEYRLIKKIGDN